MDGPSFDLPAFLAERLRPASVATTGRAGGPALATMWFLAEDGRFWFNTPNDQPSPFLAAARAGREVAVLVSTFDPPDDVRQLRATGPARIEPTDHDRLRRLYLRYVPQWTDEWAAHAFSPKFTLWSMSPARGMAVAFPELADSPTFRWSEPLVTGPLAPRRDSSAG
ncbi:pyridoxamine 5'-phosphate oxidase family protein [Amycolatopsis sp. YIM 10]|uniref:pyridoxamine 5'-phosphate oxidase family protein n=1 Tax=Amycolatopsis sp. YIM 10 TaxID=2653857 RepID=UPI0012906BDC|nr:pyridoxamine 5'-phosphate oxidase family protein [Amycolatopsis sp. YIM 10]